MKCSKNILVGVILSVLAILQVEALSASSSRYGKDTILTATTTATTEGIKPPTVSSVNLGQDKFVNLFFPADSRQFSNQFESGTKMTTANGAGDVVWASGFALSRLIAHCPSIVNGRNVLELGCGLGVVAAAACKYSRPNHVALSDNDKSALALAYASCVQLQRSKSSVSRSYMDWSKPQTWPAQEYDVLLAADVLYDKSGMLPLVNVLHHYLCDDVTGRKLKRAVIVDPVYQGNRDAFCFAAYKAGLDVEVEEFPGSPDLKLLSVYPSN
jgi:hypothetical protein